jgi:5-(carboxyamino)imidazole ribonucleotide mutase
MDDKKPKVGILMGSDSDLEIMKDAAKALESFGVFYEMAIISAHRTPKRMMEYAAAASGRGIKVIIAGAGGAAHVPGMIAAITTLPVIGVPIMGKSLNGLDSLFSIVQMPSGIPVAAVAINGAKNAGILATEILATGDPELQTKLENYKKDLESQVQEKSAKLEQLGYENYLKQK